MVKLTARLPGTGTLGHRCSRVAAVTSLLAGEGSAACAPSPRVSRCCGVSLGSAVPPTSPQDLSHRPQHGCTTASLRSSCRTGSVPPTVTRGVWQEAGQRAPPLPVRVSHESRPPRRLRTGDQRELTTARNPLPLAAESASCGCGNKPHALSG